MIDAFIAAFAGSPWPLYLVLYLAVGWVLIRPTGPITGQLASIMGWPIEMTQRLAGATGLPYLFLLPNMLVFGLFTFAPMFINLGFAVTEGQSILFDERAFAGLDNLRRLKAASKFGKKGTKGKTKSPAKER